MKTYSFSIIFEPEDEGGFSVHCPALPGCVSQGESYEEALTNIRESIKGYVKSLTHDGLPVPEETVSQEIEIFI
jgi:predicted RNase H-like HicB family nuclease